MRNINKNKIEKEALILIKEHKLVFINEICSFLSISRATFYNYGLDKLDSIKEALDNNKISLKAGLRNKWYQSNNPTVQIALYKLLADNDERQALNTNNTVSDSENGEGTLCKLVDSLNRARITKSENEQIES